MRQLFINMVLLLLLPGIQSSAQNYLRVTGTVTEAETNTPLPGVSVILKGTDIGTITQLEGNYAIDIPTESDLLEFSFVGMETQIISVSGRNRIDVAMHPAINTLHEWLICGKSFLEPALSFSSRFPFSIGAGFLDKDLQYCCNNGNDIHLGLIYGTDFKKNQIFHSKAGIDNIGITKRPLGVMAEYNNLSLSGSEGDTLISDYRFTLSMNRILRNISIELGMGLQGYNTQSNIGYGGRISIMNEFDDSYPRHTFAIQSGFWYWGDYNEYNISVNLFMNNSKNITDSILRRTRLGCEIKQIDKVRFASITFGCRFLIKKLVVGCG